MILFIADNGAREGVSVSVRTIPLGAHDDNSDCIGAFSILRLKSTDVPRRFTAPYVGRPPGTKRNLQTAHIDRRRRLHEAIGAPSLGYTWLMSHPPGFKPACARRPHRPNAVCADNNDSSMLFE